MRVSWLPDPERHPLWEGVKSLLEPAAKRGGIPVDPDELIWIAHEDGVIFAAASTLLWGDGEAELRLAGGTRFRDWMGLLDEAVSGWAKAGGANRLTMRGRKGWARFARAFGWVVLDRDEDGRQLYEKVL